jgi:predicted NAD/FAD-binding protein
MDKIAIIGTGIAGMGCGHFLHPTASLTFYEQNDYVGGHTNTVTLGDVHVDTGFMVFNYKTYPNLCRLFKEIGAPVKPTDMSFSVQYRPAGLEYSGSSLNHLFAQRRNLLNPRFIRMLMQINRFNKESVKILDDPRYKSYTIGDYVREKHFGEDFLWRYLVPMSSAVWSTPMDKMLDFPAVTLIRFFHNHGFLGLDTQHQWYTLEGGSRSYRDLLIAPFKEHIRVGCAASAVTREGDRVSVRAADGSTETYDKVILACHGDQALALLTNPLAEERRVLSNFSYQPNKAVLHTDASVMPVKRLAWSSWNYRVEDGAPPSTIYWMNRLQGVSDARDYFVSINPSDNLDPQKVLKTIDYEHPLFDLKALQAQTALPLLNETGPVYFCGSYFRYGFHEDAFTSAVGLCSRLLKRPVYPDNAYLTAG